MYQYKCELLKVIDGDTIDANIDLGFDIYVKKRIRLFGINTPECRTRDKEEKARGLLAKARLTEILEENNNNFILLSTSLGKYGRSLGIIYVDTETKQSVNNQLIKENLAVKFP